MNWLCPTRINTPHDTYVPKGFEQVLCSQCKKELTPVQVSKGGRFCSSHCVGMYQVARASLQKLEPAVPHCLYCGKTNPSSLNKRRKFCSSDCNYQYHNLMRRRNK